MKDAWNRGNVFWRHAFFVPTQKLTKNQNIKNPSDRNTELENIVKLWMQNISQNVPSKAFQLRFPFFLFGLLIMKIYLSKYIIRYGRIWIEWINKLSPNIFSLLFLCFIVTEARHQRHSNKKVRSAIIFSSFSVRLCNKNQ